jgi:hypothetical protein
MLATSSQRIRWPSTDPHGLVEQLSGVEQLAQAPAAALLVGGDLVDAAHRPNVWRGVSWYQSCDRWPNRVPIRAASSRRFFQGTIPARPHAGGWRMPVSI